MITSFTSPSFPPKHINQRVKVPLPVQVPVTRVYFGASGLDWPDEKQHFQYVTKHVNVNDFRLNNIFQILNSGQTPLQALLDLVFSNSGYHTRQASSYVDSPGSNTTRYLTRTNGAHFYIEKSTVFSALLQLPPEIRNKIYQYSLLRAKQVSTNMGISHFPALLTILFNASKDNEIPEMLRLTLTHYKDGVLSPANIALMEKQLIPNLVKIKPREYQKELDELVTTFLPKLSIDQLRCLSTLLTSILQIATPEDLPTLIPLGIASYAVAKITPGYTTPPSLKKAIETAIEKADFDTYKAKLIVISKQIFSSDHTRTPNTLNQYSDAVVSLFRNSDMHRGLSAARHVFSSDDAHPLNALSQLRNLTTHRAAQALYSALEQSTYPYKEEPSNHLRQQYSVQPQIKVSATPMDMPTRRPSQPDMLALPPGSPARDEDYYDMALVTLKNNLAQAGPMDHNQKEALGHRILTQYLNASSAEERAFWAEVNQLILKAAPHEIVQELPPTEEAKKNKNQLNISGYSWTKNENSHQTTQETSTPTIYNVQTGTFSKQNQAPIPDVIRMHKADGTDIYLDGVMLRQLDAMDGIWNRAKLEGSNFEDCRWYGVGLPSFWAEGNHFKDVVFSKSFMGLFYLSGNTFSNVSFYRTSFKGGFFKDNVFEGKCDFNLARFEHVSFIGSDLSRVQNLRNAKFIGCTYLEGHAPKLPDGMTPEDLGIQKERDPKLHFRVKAITPDNQFLSQKPIDVYDTLSPDAQVFFYDLARQRSSGRLKAPDGLAAQIQEHRESFYRKALSPEHGFWVPSARDPENKGPLDLGLENYPIVSNNGETYLNLRGIKDVCFAQQIYSMYCSAGDKLQKKYWCRRLVEGYGRDFNEEMRTGNGWDVSDDREHAFLDWLKNKYRLYDGAFSLESTLEAIMSEDGLMAVAGNTENKRRIIQQIFAPLVFPAINLRVNSKVAKGWLFDGPPGTGKTFLGHAISRQLGLEPVMLTKSSVGSGYQYQTDRNVEEKFETAVQLAQEQGASVILMDEGGQMGSQRQADKRSGEDVVETLLELYTKHIERGKYPVIVIATDNRGGRFDNALVRGGRLGNTLKVDFPDSQTRKAFLEKVLPKPNRFLRKDPYEGGYNRMLSYITEKTQGLGIGDIQQLVDVLNSSPEPEVTEVEVLDRLAGIREKRKKRNES